MNKTSIEWTQRSANPIRARRKDTGKVGWHCVKKSAGCAHCYSEPINRRFGTGLPFTRHSSDLVEFFLEERVLAAILRLKKPQKVFVCDMTDLFQDGISVEDIAVIFAVFAVAHWHTFQILTKRPERMAEILCNSAFPAMVARMIDERVRPMIDGKIKGDWGLVSPTAHGLRLGQAWPLSNVWTGFSAEDQATFDARAVAAAPLMRAGWLAWVSAEPLLGPIDLHFEEWRQDAPDESPYLALSRNGQGIRWVVSGGESGPDARPCHPDWARSLRGQCLAAGVPFHWKQWGAWVPDGQAMPWLKDVIGARNAHVSRALFPDGSHLPDLTGRGTNGDRAIVIRRVGKKHAGRLLDGREWNEFPDVTVPGSRPADLPGQATMF